jgi:4-carboxymuconolactone decarboxylase
MAIREDAQKNHDALFPHHESVLKKTDPELVEIFYQAVPYVGMARAFDFLHVTNDVLVARGVALPLPPQSTAIPETRREAGLAVQRRILGDALDRLRGATPEDQGHILRSLSAHCFGDHYTLRIINEATAA